MRDLETIDTIAPMRLETWQRLAGFRYRIRRFLRFSERVARSQGVTPQQHQLLLGVAGYTGRGWATISELAEFLQGRHNAVVGLVQRAAQKGVVRKLPGKSDRRFVKVYLTRKGHSVLTKISEMNMAELRKLQFEIQESKRRRPRTLSTAQGL